MGIISNIVQKVKKGKEEGKSICEKVDAFILSTEQKLSGNEDYLDIALPEKVRAACAYLKKELSDLPLIALLTNNKIYSKKRELDALSENISWKVSDHNDRVASVKAEDARKIIGNVEGRKLDEQQMKCIIKPAPSHLVIAGAGTGKTTTIVGKVKYLLNSRQCSYKDILVLSFTKASAAEMCGRIHKETGQAVEISTFHKLGIDIIEKANGISPKITKISLQAFAKEKLVENMKDPKYLNHLCRYFLFNPKYAKSEFDFHNIDEYLEYLHINPPVTLKGDKVKSYGEMNIANFLFVNGIRYEYEKEYEHDTRTEDRYQYYPDFFLPDKGIYIEYFGINEKGEVPAYFKSREGKSPSQEYSESMEWKRRLHSSNNTVLIECYSYERSKGELLSSLEKKLRKAGVEFNPISTEEIWNIVSEKNSKNTLTGISELIGKIISLMKNNGYDIEKLREICEKTPGVRISLPLVDLIAPIYGSYVDTLKENGEIDFDDMINDAVRVIRNGKYKNPYKYVIVDEYQDISKSRYNLLKALRDSNDYKLFCVGDDWQSIYRFTGSDMGFILNFSKYWGASEYSKIETTYRFTDSLIDISSAFVMKNPIQIKKSIKGTPSKIGFAMGEIKGPNEYIAIRFMLNRLRELPQDSTVFFIGRYTFDSKLLSECEYLKCSYNVATEEAVVVFPERKDLRMQFLTAHKSKGLQADYVFIINNKKRGMGFPCKIQDDPLVDCLLEEKDDFPFAEERRLFYVALTRARVKSFLVVVNDNESVFASEMEGQYASELRKEPFTCPLCGGKLERQRGPNGEFYGCSNHQLTGCNFVRKIKKRQFSDRYLYPADGGG